MPRRSQTTEEALTDLLERRSQLDVEIARTQEKAERERAENDARLAAHLGAVVIPRLPTYPDLARQLHADLQARYNRDDRRRGLPELADRLLVPGGTPNGSPPHRPAHGGTTASSPGPAPDRPRGGNPDQERGM